VNRHTEGKRLFSAQAARLPQVAYREYEFLKGRLAFKTPLLGCPCASLNPRFISGDDSMLLPKDEYLKTVRRPYPSLYASMMLEGLSQVECFQGIVDAPFAIRNLVISDSIWYYSKSEIKTLADLAFRYWNHPERLVTLQQLFLRREQAILDAVDKSLEVFRAAFSQYMSILISVFSVENLLDQELTKLLNTAFTEEEALDIRPLLVTPERDNYFKAQEYHLVATQDFVVNMRDYEWLNSRYGSENPLTKDDLSVQLDRIDKTTYLKRYGEEKTAIRIAINTARAKLGEHAHFVDLLQFLMYYRTHRTDVINRVLYQNVPRFRLLASAKSIKYENLLECTISEAVSIVPEDSELEARQRSTALVLSEGKLQLFSGVSAEKVSTYFKETPLLDDSVHGDVACEGEAIGRVKVVLNSMDYQKVQTGDILITSMTTPDMFPIMKLASAFLTDEGGVTCHAAIVARELRKPCIIGTHFATKVFHDGDYVRFDTTNGNVTKVSTPDAHKREIKVIWIIDDIPEVRHEIEAALSSILNPQGYVIDAHFNNIEEPVAEIKRIIQDSSRRADLPSVIITDLFLDTKWRDGLDVLRKINKTLRKFSEVAEQFKARKISVFVFSYFRRFFADNYAGNLDLESDYARAIGELDLMSIPVDHVLDKEKPEFTDDGTKATDAFKNAVNNLAEKVKHHLEASNASYS
jgi:phosphohistidine swiveling domain-containing protein